MASQYLIQRNQRLVWDEEGGAFCVHPLVSTWMTDLQAAAYAFENQVTMRRINQRLTELVSQDRVHRAAATVGLFSYDLSGSWDRAFRPHYLPSLFNAVQWTQEDLQILLDVAKTGRCGILLKVEALKTDLSQIPPAQYATFAATYGTQYLMRSEKGAQLPPSPLPLVPGHATAVGMVADSNISPQLLAAAHFGDWFAFKRYLDALSVERPSDYFSGSSSVCPRTQSAFDAWLNQRIQNDATGCCIGGIGLIVSIVACTIGGLFLSAHVKYPLNPPSLVAWTPRHLLLPIGATLTTLGGLSLLTVIIANLVPPAPYFSSQGVPTPTLAGAVLDLNISLTDYQRAGIHTYAQLEARLAEAHIYTLADWTRSPYVGNLPAFRQFLGLNKSLVL